MVSQTSSFRADILAEDQEGRWTLLVEIHAHDAAPDSALQQLRADLAATRDEIPFAMIVDLKKIQVFKFEDANLKGPVCTLATAEVLEHYDADFSSKRIFSDYLGTLVEAWLRDLAYHWKSPVVPGDAQLNAIGLLSRLQGGFTRREVELRGYPVS